MEIVKMIMPIIVIVILGFGALWGFIRKLHRTLFRFVFLLLAMGAAFFLAKQFSGAVSGLVFDVLKSAEIKELTDILENSEATELVGLLCRLLATPFLFLVFYIVLKPISWIPYKICSILFGVKGPRLLGRSSGALAGLLCGLVGLLVFVTPVFGYLNLADDVVNHFLSEEEIPEEYAIVADIADTPVAAQVHELLGARMFTALTTETVDEGAISLEQEVKSIVAVVEDATVLAEKSPEEYGPAEADTMDRLAHDVGQSQILSSLLSSVLSDVSDAWLKGEEAFGMSKPDMGADMQGIVDAFLTVFSTSDAQNIEQDLTTFADVFGIFIEEEMLTMLSDEEGNMNAFVEKLVSDGVAAELYGVLDRNPRMAPVKAAIIDTGMRLVLDQLGVSDELLENHGDVMESIVNVAQGAVNADGTLNTESLTSGLQGVLEENDIEVSEEVTQIVADGIAETFTAEELENLTVPELVDKLIDRFADAELPENVTIPDDWQGMIPQN